MHTSSRGWKGSDSEKLVHLEHALKEASLPLRFVSFWRILYTEAVEWLQSCYNHPRLIHQTHVRMIIDAPPRRDGNGKELRRLHDTVLQHLERSKSWSMNLLVRSSPPYLSSYLTLTPCLNGRNTDAPGIHQPSCSSFWSICLEPGKRVKNEVHIAKKFITSSKSVLKSVMSSKPIASFAGADDLVNCVSCKSGKHPLYTCPKFKSLTCDMEKWTQDSIQPSHSTLLLPKESVCTVCAASWIFWWVWASPCWSDLRKKWPTWPQHRKERKARITQTDPIPYQR